ncbi:hypothetical protein E2C01_030242 [Portunus trituberculatus]|uniref:Uncharacterized protein n=1 Tax=Portunus trituberculatus TaxID=210409 RepID=A0A5B7EV61_PORTR|nr:hypothetical protein [Portunus trituberculatus]
MLKEVVQVDKGDEVAPESAQDCHDEKQHTQLGRSHQLGHILQLFSGKTATLDLDLNGEGKSGDQSDEHEGAKHIEDWGIAVDAKRAHFGVHQEPTEGCEQGCKGTPGECNSPLCWWTIVSATASSRDTRIEENISARALRLKYTHSVTWQHDEVSSSCVSLPW